MIESREVFSPAFEQALLANRVVSALLMKEQTDPTERREALDSAIQFLQKMMRAVDTRTSLQVSDDSYHSALAYSNGIRAYQIVSRQDIGDPAKVEAMLNDLVETAVTLRDSSVGKDENEQQLTSFFRCVRDISVHEGSSTLEKVTF